jgi:hypothetical protein
MQSLPSVTTLVAALVNSGGSASLGEPILATNGQGSAVWWSSGEFRLPYPEQSYVVDNCTIYCGGDNSVVYAYQAYSTGGSRGIQQQLGAAAKASRRKKRLTAALWLTPLICLSGVT